jgi:hypothetical protein
MARSRILRPGIFLNEDLWELGPYAHILFTGLWTLADRYGRLEDRPRRIQAQIFPYGFNVTFPQDTDRIPKVLNDSETEVLLAGLASKGFIHRYSSGSAHYIQIVNWTKHQKPHSSEDPSEIPPPPVSPGPAPVSPLECGETTVVQNSNHSGFVFSKKQTAVAALLLVTCSNTSEDRSIGGVLGVPGGIAKPAAPENDRRLKNPEPHPPPSASVPNQPARKPAKSEVRPARESRVAGAAVARGAPEASRRPIPADKPSRPAAGPVTDWWPYSRDDVTLVRADLNYIAREARMPLPDDGLIRQVLDTGGGAPISEISEVLERLIKKRKFQSMYSWGFVPLVLRQWFKTPAPSSAEVA